MTDNRISERLRRGMFVYQGDNVIGVTGPTAQDTEAADALDTRDKLIEQLVEALEPIDRSSVDVSHQALIINVENAPVTKLRAHAAFTAARAAGYGGRGDG